MFEPLHDAMKAHALDAWPAAACGGVFGRGGGAVYRPLDGVAAAPRETFRIDAAAVREVDASLGAPAAIVIAHPSPEGAEGGKIDPLLFTPSAAEMRAQLDLALPFGVVVCDRAQAYRPFWFGDQCPIPPLLGRPFRHGVTDCFSVVRDWYRQERRITFAEFPRDWNWWIEGRSLYLTGFEQAGFRPIEAAEARPGDGVLFRLRSRTPNHAGMLVDGGWMLHHPGSLRPYDFMSLSHHDRLDRWARHATHWLRYEGQPAGR